MITFLNNTFARCAALCQNVDRYSIITTSTKPQQPGTSGKCLRIHTIANRWQTSANIYQTQSKIPIERRKPYAIKEK